MQRTLPLESPLKSPQALDQREDRVVPPAGARMRGDHSAWKAARQAGGGTGADDDRQVDPLEEGHVVSGVSQSNGDNVVVEPAKRMRHSLNSAAFVVVPADVMKAAAVSPMQATRFDCGQQGSPARRVFEPSDHLTVWSTPFQHVKFAAPDRSGTPEIV